MQPDLILQAERALLERQRLPPEFGDGYLRPSYDGLGLANIAATPLRWLAPEAVASPIQEPLPPFDAGAYGVPALVDAWLEWESTEPIRHVIVLLADGLGFDQLRGHVEAGDAPNLGRAIQEPRSFYAPATTVFPSTTTTALTSLATAYPPAFHGIMGTTLYLRELGAPVSFISFRMASMPSGPMLGKSQLDQEALVPGLNLYQRMEAAGGRVEIVNHHEYRYSGITRFTSRNSLALGEHYNAYRYEADAIAQCRERVLATSDRERTFTYLYVPNIDTTAHHYGPHSPSNRAEVAAFDFSLHRELLAPLEGRRDTVLLLTADHGHARTSPKTTVWVNDHPELAAMLATPIAGDGRAAYLYPKQGAVAAVTEYVERRLGDSFVVMPRERAAALGLFGPPETPLAPAAADRTGDVILVARGNWTIRQQITSDPRPPGFIGVHAGLSRAEMLIPFLAYRFG